jgi:hypothetical protein
MTSATIVAPNEQRTSHLIQLLKAVEVAHEKEDDSPGTSESQRLEAHDHVLVKCLRERCGFSDIRSTPRSFELPAGAEERGNFARSAPVIMAKIHLRVPCQGFLFSSSAPATTASACRSKVEGKSGV